MPDGRKFGLHLLAITSRMLSRLSKVYLWKDGEGYVLKNKAKN
jgi:hypothetical protein